ncbi:unnamed protein product [Cyprideis torosa]|uniref:Uncharacterized protein n=1 Tax=Cyprideis torosa TaxID=163714 RepID=A0A7R8WCP9_9CRUS|nr:unnamed protein product [Cyprideis torosa]CAG0888187.1 unnamed protein product [Cyprideis torosa]
MESSQSWNVDDKPVWYQHCVRTFLEDFQSRRDEFSPDQVRIVVRILICSLNKVEFLLSDERNLTSKEDSDVKLELNEETSSSEHPPIIIPTAQDVVADFLHVEMSQGAPPSEEIAELTSDDATAIDFQLDSPSAEPAAVEKPNNEARSKRRRKTKFPRKQIPALMLPKHLQEHEEDTVVACRDCNKTFPNKRSLSNHTQRNHRPENWIICDVCGKSVYKYFMDKHLDAHRANAPKTEESESFPCELCGKTYATQQRLYVHLRATHKPSSLVCAICGQAFKFKGKLREHEAIHRGESLYKCKLCGEGFARQRQMKYHERKHNNDKRYKCTYCPKAFLRKDYLSEHLNSHTGARPFACKICGLTYTSMGSMYTHIRNKHKTGDQSVSGQMIPLATQSSVEKSESHSEENSLMESEVECKPFWYQQCSHSFLTNLYSMRGEITEENIIKIAKFFLASLNFVADLLSEGPLKSDDSGEARFQEPELTDDVVSSAEKTSSSFVSEEPSKNSTIQREETSKKSCLKEEETEFVCLRCEEPVSVEKLHDSALSLAWCSKCTPEPERAFDSDPVQQERGASRKSCVLAGSEDLPFHCEECPASFETRRKLHYHMTQKHPSATKKYACDECGQLYHNRNSLYYHKTHKHAPTTKCHLCNLTLPSRSMPTHLLEHGKEEAPARCPQCEEILPNKKLLSHHIRREHRPDNWIPCEICGQSVYKYHMKKHRDIHATLTPSMPEGFPCTLCGKTYSTLARLTSHERGVHKESHLVCSICGKGFRFKSQLREHEAMHTGEALYKCKLCGLGFGRRRHLRLHVMKHTNDRRHKCPHCPKAFFKSDTLKEHLNVHTGARPFACKFCGQAYASLPSMYTHIRNKHKKMDVTVATAEEESALG